MNRTIPLVLMVALASDAHGAEPEALIQRLAKPAPASIAFQEVRFSALLSRPLIVAGELGYSGPASLDRRVTTPYQETTMIRGASVRVEREGEPTRSFALKRAPELSGLLTGFSALLTGDVAALERSFSIEMSGDAASWQLQLTPKDATARRRLRQILIDGRRDQPRCFSMLNTDGGASVMLLGEAAQRELSSAASLDDLEQLCRTR
jgi:Outer membrane lipoprotein carrier protein LolA-like